MDSLCPALLLLERGLTESTQLQSLLGRDSVVAVTTFDTLDAAVQLLKTVAAKVEADQAVA